jgi:NADH dehydrogenase FAD-containing subunit
LGDAAYVSGKAGFLRMAVQFAITQGENAGINIINSIKGLRLKEYTPVDSGYIIPMANNKSCGLVLGMELKGFLPTVFHYIMCIYRSYSFRNKLGVINNLVGRP